jgi:mannose-6-phosphate isomerase-like protein (cupin superfamily)
VETCIEAPNEAAPSRALARAPRLEALAGTLGSASANVYLRTLLPTRCLPMPVRPRVDEYLYVVHGEVDVWVAQQHVKLRAGTSITLPRDVVHRVGNFSGRPAKLLIVASEQSRVHVTRRDDGERAGRRQRADRVSAVVTPGAVHVALG